MSSAISLTCCADCDSSDEVDLIGDWQDLAGLEGTFSFMADMDVDCDGVAWQCPVCVSPVQESKILTRHRSQGNPDGQSETSFGKMDATQAPWYVIPEKARSSCMSDLKC